MNTSAKYSSLLFAAFISLPAFAAEPVKAQVMSKEQKAAREEMRFPIGCRPVGYDFYLRVVSLHPGKEGALQSLYFFYNTLPQTISLYQMRDEDSEYSTRVNHTIGPNQWAALATGEPSVKFICTLGDGKQAYGKIVDCAQTLKVCEYVNVKFGLNNKGNFWVSNGNTRNGAVSDVVHYGIIPGV
ncbi:MAG: endopeptidase IV [Legionella sp. 40-6]|nr:endopeptidase IV [Legionella sp.]OJX87712.1 MAG: endopeptidase IV [Legionella sp. 40-6]